MEGGNGHTKHLIRVRTLNEKFFPKGASVYLRVHDLDIPALPMHKVDRLDDRLYRTEFECPLGTNHVTLSVFYEDADGNEVLDDTCPKRRLQWSAAKPLGKGAVEAVTKSVRRLSFTVRKNKDKDDPAADASAAASSSSSDSEALFVRGEWLFGHKLTSLRLISSEPRQGGSQNATCVVLLGDEMDLAPVAVAGAAGGGRGRGSGLSEAPPSAGRGRGDPGRGRGDAGRGATKSPRVAGRGKDTVRGTIDADSGSSAGRGETDIVKETLLEFDKLRNTYPSEKHTILTVGAASKTSAQPLAEAMQQVVIERAKELQIFGINTENVIAEQTAASEVYMMSGILYYLTQRGYAKLVMVLRRAHVERMMMLWTRVRGMVKVAFVVHPVDDLVSTAVDAKMKKAQEDLAMWSQSLHTPRTPTSGGRSSSRIKNSDSESSPSGTPKSGRGTPKSSRKSFGET